MKIGLLNACTPEEEVEFNASEYDNFRDFLDLVSNEIELVHYRITEGEFPADPRDCDGYLITGSPRGVYDSNPWIAELGDFVRATHAADVKLAGICFGHQILAHALGGHAEKSEKGWGMGLRDFELKSGDTPDWLTLPADNGECNLYFCHQDQVMTLPNNATLLAGSEFCPNAMFTIEDKVFGMQGHPEFTQKTMVDTVEYFNGKLEDAFLQEVSSTVGNGKSPDDVHAARWVVSFFES